MQILYLVLGSIQQYVRDIQESSAADRYRLVVARCAKPGRVCWRTAFTTAHWVYKDFDDSIPIRRYLRRDCRRTVSLLHRLRPALCAA